MKIELLKNKIKERGLKFNYIAGKLDLSEYGFSLKLRGTTEFKWSEIEKIVMLLNLSEKEKKEIFFTDICDLNTRKEKGDD